MHFTPDMREVSNSRPYFGRLPGVALWQPMWVVACRAPALNFLAMDMVHAPSLANGLLQSSGPSLQHLQMVMARQEILEAPGQLLEGLWRAIGACTELAALQLIFLADGQAPDQQVAPTRGNVHRQPARCLKPILPVPR